MSRYRHWRYRRRYYKRRKKSSFNSAARTGWRAARFGGKVVSTASFGALKLGTKVTSHLAVAGVSTAAKIGRALFSK